MITIGVTGGVGSGKSEILRYMENAYNCRVLLSDDAAKEMELPGGALYEPLLKLLTGCAVEEGQRELSVQNSAEPSIERHGDLLLENGEIDKAEMARRIFADAELLKKVNELVHPAVNRYILDEIERERKAGEREFFVLESALLVENGYDRIMDSMWFIYCDEKVRSERLKESRGYSDEKIRQIIGKQVCDDVYRRHCDVVIDNTGPLTDENGALSQVDAAIKGLREKFSA